MRVRYRTNTRVARMGALRLSMPGTTSAISRKGARWIAGLRQFNGTADGSPRPPTAVHGQILARDVAREIAREERDRSAQVVFGCHASQRSARDVAVDKRIGLASPDAAG